MWLMRIARSRWCRPSTDPGVSRPDDWRAAHQRDGCRERIAESWNDLVQPGSHPHREHRADQGSGVRVRLGYRVISFDARWPVMDIISFSGAPSSAIVRPPLFGVRAPYNEEAQRRRISCETSCRTRLG